MTNGGGRQIRVVLTEGGTCYPFPLIDTATKGAKFRRPSQAMYDFLWEAMRLGLVNAPLLVALCRDFNINEPFNKALTGKSFYTPQISSAEESKAKCAPMSQ